MNLMKINIFIIYADVLNANRSVSIETSHKKKFAPFSWASLSKFINRTYNVSAIK